MLDKERKKEETGRFLVGCTAYNRSVDFCARTFGFEKPSFERGNSH